MSETSSTRNTVRYSFSHQTPRKGLKGQRIRQQTKACFPPAPPAPTSSEFGAAWPHCVATGRVTTRSSQGPLAFRTFRKHAAYQSQTLLLLFTFATSYQHYAYRQERYLFGASSARATKTSCRHDRTYRKESPWIARLLASSDNALLKSNDFKEAAVQRGHECTASDDKVTNTRIHSGTGIPVPPVRVCVCVHGCTQYVSCYSCAKIILLCVV